MARFATLVAPLYAAQHLVHVSRDGLGSWVQIKPDFVHALPSYPQRTLRGIMGVLVCVCAGHGW